jgi:chemotaxis protein CheX
MPAATQEISETLIRDNITRAVCDVFKTMLHRSAKLDQMSVGGGPDECPPALREENLALKPQVVGTVGFLGEINGLIYLYFDDSFAKDCTGHLLGMSAAEVTEAGDEVINDAIGEITNMTVGGFKNTLCDMGFPCKLTVPAIVRGNNLSVAAIKSSTRHVFQFDCGGQRLVADIQIKIE